MAERVLVVDDDERLADMVAEFLGRHGFVADVRHRATTGLAQARAGGYDAVLLDVMLPDGDGLELCRTLRAEDPSLPLLMLTARGEDTDRIVGLELGADDYLPKPFNPRELVARLKAVLRRARPVAEAGTLRFGRLEIDRGARVARLDGAALALTAHQFDLLCALAERPGRVLSRDQLLQVVRGEERDALDRSVDVHISRLRSAIEDDPRRPRRILTMRGAGYLFAEAQD